MRASSSYAELATHAIALGADGDHTSQFRVARRAAGAFGRSDREGTGVIDHIGELGVAALE